MGFYVLVQPDESASAEMVEHVLGHPSLIVQCGGSQIAVQFTGGRNGVVSAIAFGRALGNAALEFADRCDALTRLSPADRSERTLTNNDVNDRAELHRGEDLVGDDE